MELLACDGSLVVLRLDDADDVPARDSIPDCFAGARELVSRVSPRGALHRCEQHVRLWKEQEMYLGLRKALMVELGTQAGAKRGHFCVLECDVHYCFMRSTL